MRRPDYIKVGLLAIREDRMLLCRKKRGNSRLILPGGKIEPGESAVECLRRELREELSGAEATGLEHVGTWVDVAAGETKTVQIELYRGELSGDPEPSAEIGELIWFGADDERAQLAPSLLNQIIPELIARGVLQWGGWRANPPSAGRAI